MARVELAYGQAGWKESEWGVVPIRRLEPDSGAPGGVQQVEQERRLADLEDVQQLTWQGGLGPLSDASGGTGELA
jgi:hypothetical protein